MIDNKKIIALVPCRSNSIGLPGKNYRDLHGKPLFIWSVLAAMNCSYVDNIIVCSCCPFVKKEFDIFYERQNTEDKKRLLFYIRPEILDGPTVKNEEVMEYVCGKFNDDFDYMVTLQPTSPVRNNNLLENCIKKLTENNFDSLLTVSEVYPFFWNKKGNGFICPNSYYKDRPMRKDIKEEDMALFDNGNIYITGKNVLTQKKNRIGDNVYCYKTSKIQGLQIDILEDFILIEKLVDISGGIL